MESVLYQLSNRFHVFLFQQNHDGEPLLVVERATTNGPLRFFCARYVLTQGTGGENGRPIFTNELTAYDGETKTMYPTQTTRLERLQAVMESAMYGQPGSQQERVLVQDESTDSKKPIKVIASTRLFTKLVSLYDYAW